MHAKHTLIVFPIFLFMLGACGSPNGEGPAEATSQPGDLPQETPSLPEQGGEAPSEGDGNIFTTSDPCSLFSETEVEASFGADVVGTLTQETGAGPVCNYLFADNDDTFSVSIYAGEDAKVFIYDLTQAAEESCDAFFEAIFGAPAVQEGPAGDLSGTSLSDLYRQYMDITSACIYVHTQDIPDLGKNVVATETIFLDWSSKVAVLDNERIVELSYQEEIPEETLDDLNSATDEESYNTLVNGYREEVLSGYTEILLSLLRQTLTQ